jgi:hypothetical protein
LDEFDRLIYVDDLAARSRLAEWRVILFGRIHDQILGPCERDGEWTGEWMVWDMYQPLPPKPVSWSSGNSSMSNW